MIDGRCHVAILDDGISKSLLQSPLLYYNNNIFPPGKNVINRPYSHGTIVYEIINKYYSKCLFSCIKVLDRNGVCSIKRLVDAIDWCNHNNVDIIHMSIGTTRFFHTEPLIDVIRASQKRSIAIIASQSNNGRFTLPACMPEVIGVRHSDEFLPGNYIIRHNNWDGIDILTSARHIIERPDKTNVILKPSNSFASPYISALIAEIYDKEGPLDKRQLMYRLECGAKRIKSAGTYSQYAQYLDDYLLSYKSHIFGNRQALLVSCTMDANRSMHKLAELLCAYDLNTYVIKQIKENNINWNKYLQFLELKYDLDIILVGQKINPYDILIEWKNLKIELSYKDSGKKIILSSIEEICEELITSFGDYSDV